MYISTACLAAVAFSVSAIAQTQGQGSTSPGTSGSSMNQTSGQTTSSPSGGSMQSQESGSASMSSQGQSSSASDSSSAANSTWTAPYSSGAQAGMNATRPQDTQTSLRIASDAETQHTADKLSGKKVRGQDGSEIGTIKDFLVDSRTGQIKFAVVASGGFFGIGEKLRLLPYEMLQAPTQDEDLTTTLTKQQLSQAPTVQEQALEQQQVNIDQQKIEQTRQVLASGTTGSGSSAQSASDPSTSGGQLVAASKIKGKDLNAEGSKVGSVEAVVIATSGDEAMALVDPEQDIAGSDMKFLVPLSRFQLASAGSDEGITTSITRNEFQSAARTGNSMQEGEIRSGDSQTSASATSSAAPGSDVSMDTTPSTAETLATADATVGTSAQAMPTAPEPVTSDSETTAAAATDTDASSSVAQSGADGRNDNTALSAPRMPTTAPTATDAGQTGRSAWSAAGEERVSTVGAPRRDLEEQSDASSSVEADSSAGTVASAPTSPTDTNQPESTTGSAVADRTTPASTQNSSTAQLDGDSALNESSSRTAASSGTGVSDPTVQADSASTSAPPDRYDDSGFANATPTPADQAGPGSDAALNTERAGEVASTDASGTGQTDSSSGSSTTNIDTPPTPTGATSADQMPDAGGTLITAAQHVRAALDADPELAKADVRVTPGEDKLVLRGTVANESLKSRVEEMAEKASFGKEIESELKVQPQQ